MISNTGQGLSTFWNIFEEAVEPSSCLIRFKCSSQSSADVLLKAIQVQLLNVPSQDQVLPHSKHPNPARLNEEEKLTILNNSSNSSITHQQSTCISIDAEEGISNSSKRGGPYADFVRKRLNLQSPGGGPVLLLLEDANILDQKTDELKPSFWETVRLAIISLDCSLCILEFLDYSYEKNIFFHKILRLEILCIIF